MRYYKFSAAERKLVMAEAELPGPEPGQVRVRVLNPIAIPTGTFAWFADPDGNTIGLLKPAKP
jgi:hypothetical protein